MEHFKNILKLNSSELKFDNEIKEVIEFDDCYVVLTDYQNSQTNENVFGISKSGQKKWQVQKFDFITYQGKEYVGITNPYTTIEKVNNNVKLFNWDGSSFELEPKTGELITNPIASRIGKRPW